MQGWHYPKRWTIARKPSPSPYLPRKILRVCVRSSTEVAGEATLITSGTKVVGVAGVLLAITRTTLFLKAKRGSFFFAFILTYISWLKFFVIFAREKHLVKTKKTKNKKQNKNKTKQNKKKKKKGRKRREQQRKWTLILLLNCYST